MLADINTTALISADVAESVSKPEGGVSPIQQLHTAKFGSLYSVLLNFDNWISQHLRKNRSQLHAHVPQEAFAAMTGLLAGKAYDYEGAYQGFNRFEYAPYHPEVLEIGVEWSLAFLRRHLK